MVQEHTVQTKSEMLSVSCELGCLGWDSSGMEHLGGLGADFCGMKV